MKKVFLTLLLIDGLLNASAYKDGIKAYNIQEYEKAISYFKKSKEEYSNVKMQLLWAESELALGRVDYAISAYERVIILEPQNLEAVLKLIELYKKDGQDQEADSVALNFDDKNLTPQQRTALSELLSTRYVIKLDKFTARLATKIGYDSNIAFTASENNLDDFADSLDLSEEQRDELDSIKSTWYSQTLASISYTHYLEELNSLFIRMNADAMMQYNFSETLFNTKYIKAEMAVGYKMANSTVTFPIYYDRTAYLEEDLLQSYGVNPTISMVLNSRYILNIALKLNQTKYLKSKMSSYDSNTYGLDTSLYYIIGGSYIVGKLSYHITSSDNKDNTIFPPKYIDNNELIAYIGTSYRLKYGYILDAGYKFGLKYYDEYLYSKNRDIGYFWRDKKREDTYQSFNIALKKDIIGALQATTDYQYSQNRTDYYISDYNKQIFSVGLEYNF